MLVSSIARFDVNSNLNSAVFASIKAENPIMKVNSHTFNDVFKINTESLKNSGISDNINKNSKLQGEKLDFHA